MAGQDHPVRGEPPEPDEDLRRRTIVAAALRLLTAGGRVAVSTRAVSTAAGVQPPTLYRLFGDKQGLLDAVAERGLAEHLHLHTAHQPGHDPVADLRRGWDTHVGFGLANPFLYSLAYGEPRPGAPRPPAAAAAERVLAGHVHRVALAGRLRVAEARATALLHAAGTGATLALIGAAPADRDPGLSVLAREAAIAAVTTDAVHTDAVTADAVSAGAGAPTPRGTAAAAVHLRAVLPAARGLTPGEHALLAELLDRLSAAA